MVPPKKMSLEEFISDESLGGSWADDGLDVASISVPTYDSSPSYDPFGRRQDSFRQGSGQRDGGGPYIIKLLNLPLTAGDEFIDDLFASRYTKFAKCKIFVDPSTNVLESYIIKKVGFVELSTFQDMQKSLKWNDLYYKGGKRVVIEAADFQDFQNCIRFNDEHYKELLRIETDFLAGRLRPNGPNGMNGGNGPHHGPQHGHGYGHSQSFQTSHGPNSTHGYQNHERRSSFGRPQGYRNDPILGQAPGQSMVHNEAPKHKSNPFGAAKPVDTVAREHEIEKKLVHINPTTIRTINFDKETTGSSERAHRSSERVPHNSSTTPKSGLSPTQRTISPTKVDAAKKSEILGFKPAPIPSLKNGGKSLAQLLSVKPEESPSPKLNSPKPIISKPIILKKKQPVKKEPEPEVEPEADILIGTSSNGSGPASTTTKKESQTEPKTGGSESKQTEVKPQPKSNFVAAKQQDGTVTQDKRVGEIGNELKDLKVDGKENKFKPNRSKKTNFRPGEPINPDSKFNSDLKFNKFGGARKFDRQRPFEKKKSQLDKVQTQTGDSEQSGQDNGHFKSSNPKLDTGSDTVIANSKPATVKNVTKEEKPIKDTPAKVTESKATEKSGPAQDKLPNKPSPDQLSSDDVIARAIENSSKERLKHQTRRSKFPPRKFEKKKEEDKATGLADPSTVLSTETSAGPSPVVSNAPSKAPKNKNEEDRITSNISIETTREEASKTDGSGIPQQDNTSTKFNGRGRGRGRGGRGRGRGRGNFRGRSSSSNNLQYVRKSDGPTGTTTNATGTETNTAVISKVPTAAPE